MHRVEKYLLSPWAGPVRRYSPMRWPEPASRRSTYGVVAHAKDMMAAVKTQI